ncbi:MAG: 3-deoxy-7-phosphoheptulonate synthase [Lachnospiraceae bacterium]|nr:3-deoxy-7-phosphoheptulonate synthase [Lachnospiraceae bacterium]
MGMNFIKKLPIPAEIKQQLPLSERVQKIKAERDDMIRKVFTGESDKFLVIIGPCSADNEDTVCDYLGRLAKMQDKVGDRLILVPRIYTNKPRTNGQGYKGMIHQPDPEKKPDLLTGIIAIRKMHIRAIEETGLTAADEMLYPENFRYLNDILSYVAIGARSVEDQQHRMTVSGMDVPAGMKNPTSGDLSVMFNSVQAAQSQHNFIYRGWDVTTDGNDLAHVILRGAVNKHGNCIPNYHYEDLMLLLEMYGKRGLNNPAAIIDANHSNSNKQYMEQIRICHEVLHSRNYNPEIKTMIKGLMIESYLEGGSQKIGACPHVYGQSITDPCLGWDDSEKLIYDIYKMC